MSNVRNLKMLESASVDAKSKEKKLKSASADANIRLESASDDAS